MKFFKLFILLHLPAIVVSGQNSDTTLIQSDTSCFRTTNAFLVNQKNYETLNNSFITGNSFAIIRSQDNPAVLIDGIPVNPILVNNTHYREFLGPVNLLSFDIQGINVRTLQNEDKIISGNYNNAINFHTDEIKTGNSSPQFEVNNFTTFAYQDIDSAGFSSIFSFKAQKSYEKFGYRLSVNNGFQNDYIPENGLQRYSGNVKLIYNPNKQLLLTGFLDYTNFLDFKRKDENNLKSNRLLAYINTHLTLTDWLSLYGVYSFNKLSDISERDLKLEDKNWYGEYYTKSYFEKNNYKYSSNFFDFGFRFNKKFIQSTFINIKLGYNLNSLKYFIENEIVYKYSDGVYGESWFNSEPEEAEKVLYTALKLHNKYIAFSYLLNKTYYGFNKLSFKENENNTFSNHLVSLNFDLVKNSDKIINHIAVNATYGRLANYSIIMRTIRINPVPGYKEPEWTTPFSNDNIELDFLSSFYKNRIDIDFSLYYKNYSKYYHLFKYYTPGGIFSSADNIGKVTKKGYDLNGNFWIIKNNSMDWILGVSLCESIIEPEKNEELIFQLADTTIGNRIISIVSNIRYKRFRYFIEFESKNGYDVNLYKNNFSVSEPFSYGERSQISGVNNSGIPSSVIIENNFGYITDADYFILKRMGLEYQTRSNAKGQYFVIGIQYNKMRRVYLFINDTEKYQEQFQRPSFFNAVSLSLKIHL
ncbi:MAG: hypothetical protein JNL22_09085 [Bacteroidales bacterium]|nr:hypothetical protein [Bacteroidales bacterium]